MLSLRVFCNMSQDFLLWFGDYGFLSNDTSVYIVVANNIHHGSRGLLAVIVSKEKRGDMLEEVGKDSKVASLFTRQPGSREQGFGSRRVVKARRVYMGRCSTLGGRVWVDSGIRVRSSHN